MNKIVGIFIISLLVLVGINAAIILLIKPDIISGPKASPTPIPSVTPQPTLITETVKIFFVALEDNGKSGPKIGCGDSLVSVDQEINYKGDKLKNTLEQLLMQKTQFYGQSGFYNALFSSNLKVDTVSYKGSTASVYLTGEMQLGGTCDTPRFEEQLKATMLQFPEIKNAEIYINNQPIKEALSTK
jgi:hypothetical protein